jgi:hypothetical protein
MIIKKAVLRRSKISGNHQEILLINGIVVIILLHPSFTPIKKGIHARSIQIIKEPSKIYTLSNH